MSIDELWAVIVEWSTGRPFTVGAIIALAASMLEIWLKMNARPKGAPLIVRDDAVLWPAWVVSSGAAGVFFFLMDSIDKTENAGPKAIALTACVVVGFTIPPFIVRFSTRPRKCGCGKVISYDPTVWRGIILPNVVGLLVLMATVYTGLRNPMG